MAGHQVAWSGELTLAEARWTDKDGHTVKFKLSDTDRSGANPFKQFTKRRGNRAGTRFKASIMEVSRPSHAAYAGELMLAGWGDTSTQGHVVTFWIEPPLGARMHPFEGYVRDKDVFMAALSELDDDDETIDQRARDRVEKAYEKPKRRSQTLSQAAALMCANPLFWQWAETQGGEWQVSSNQEAAVWMRDQLGIESRRALDDYEHVAEAFHEQIRKPFHDWMQAKEGTPF